MLWYLFFAAPYSYFLKFDWQKYSFYVFKIRLSIILLILVCLRLLWLVKRWETGDTDLVARACSWRTGPRWNLVDRNRQGCGWRRHTERSGRKCRGKGHGTCCADRPYHVDTQGWAHTLADKLRRGCHCTLGYIRTSLDLGRQHWVRTERDYRGPLPEAEELLQKKEVVRQQIILNTFWTSNKA